MSAATPALDARPDLTVRLAAPRGFCAGVERAIRTVEKALAHYGAPVYVRHEIVHNAHVVSRLKAMGAIFVDNLQDAPDGRPVIFSAHGAPKAVHEEAASRQMLAIDATCPLVQKVHAETRRHAARGRHVILIGHAGHPEVEGTMGQLAPGNVSLIQSLDDADRLEPPDGAPLAYATQTTLSVDDTAAIIARLKSRFPGILGPRSADICYATSNRQAAVKQIAQGADLVVVIGSPASSNSRRLVDTAIASGAAQSILLDDPAAFDFTLLGEEGVIGVTAGASAPESLVEDFLTLLANRYRLAIETVETVKEDITFKTPLLLAG